MDIYTAVAKLKRGLEDCAYEFGSTSYQDRCESIDVRASGGEIYVYINMYVVEQYYKSEVDDNISSTIESLQSQYEIPYAINLNVRYRYRY